MFISDITKIAAVNAGKIDGAKESNSYTCASECPTVQEMVAIRPEYERDDFLMQINDYWYNGYVNARANKLVNLNHTEH